MTGPCLRNSSSERKICFTSHDVAMATKFDIDIYLPIFVLYLKHYLCDLMVIDQHDWSSYDQEP